MSVIRHTTLAFIALATAHCWSCAYAQGVSTLYAFQSRPDGNFPNSLIVSGGTLYGTTGEGGSGNCKTQGVGYHSTIGCGTIFSINSDTGKERVLYSFPDGARGKVPNGLIRAGADIYGTTYTGGIPGPPCSFINRGKPRYIGCGVVFKFDLATGLGSVLHKFTGVDGAEPSGGILAYHGMLYGTTSEGGNQNGGILYDVDPATGAEKVLHDFSADDGDNDGRIPNGDLIAANGLIYGTTDVGGAGCGANGCGAAFSFDPATGVETLLYSFQGLTDGSLPSSGLIHVGGKLYGVTAQGGDPNCFSGNGCGTVYSLDPGTGSEIVLYAFKGASDGQFARGSLVYQNGYVYGTTANGGTSNCGTAFSVNISTGSEQVLYSFPCDGVFNVGPENGMVAAAGILYGVDPYVNELGSVFKLVP